MAGSRWYLDLDAQLLLTLDLLIAIALATLAGVWDWPTVHRRVALHG